MSEEENHRALIPRPPSALERIGPGPRDILSRMVSDALALARSKNTALNVARFRIGNYEFCDPDYRQILQWAKALKLEPDEVVQRLDGSSVNTIWHGSFGFVVENGAIISLVLDFNLLPLTVFEWMEGLIIRDLGFKGKPEVSPQLALRLSFLNRLYCCRINLTELDLSKVPGLTYLWCSENQLTELDLSKVPGLTLLQCFRNPLTELDLSKVPGLTYLWCSDNQLTELDLSKVPGLTFLQCFRNQLTKLDLSKVPGLTNLCCSGNQLTKLDLSHVLGLTKLYCSENQLSELDIRPLRNLNSYFHDPSVTLRKHREQKF